MEADGTLLCRNVLESVPVHVEINQKDTSTEDKSTIKEETKKLLSVAHPVFSEGPVDFSSNDYLCSNVDSITICDIDESPLSSGPISFWQAELVMHVFQLSEEGPEQECMEGEEDIAACDQWVLPAADLHNLWESLVLEKGIKNQLLEYATSALLFSDKGVDKTLISWNRVVLLHGPPGTGKTSLCRALAQKLSVRLSDRYSDTQLLEINAHSLFSKWFSESGKLVMRLFQHIIELVEDEESLVCVLIDEVESLTAARSAALNGNEPSDAVRVVNAMLTQIDNLRKYNNVLILTTSNISSAIDLAFVDRADIKQYIGLPPTEARYDILRSCMKELMRVGIIAPSLEIDDYKTLMRQSNLRRFAKVSPVAEGPEMDTTSDVSSQENNPGLINKMNIPIVPVTKPTAGHTILEAAELATDLSGRALRKLPFQAHAFFVQRKTTTPEEYAAALLSAVQKEQRNRKNLEKTSAASSSV